MFKLDEHYVEWKNDPVQYEDVFFTELRKQVNLMIGDRVLRDREDVVQDAVVRILRRMSRFDPAKAPFAAWVRLNTNAAVFDHLHSVYIEQERVADLGVDEAGVAITLDDVNGQSATQRAAEWLVEPTWSGPELSYLFAGDDELVKALLQSTNLAQVERKTGRSRKAVRCAIERAKRRYAEMQEAA